MRHLYFVPTQPSMDIALIEFFPELAYCTVTFKNEDNVFVTAQNVPYFDGVNDLMRLRYESLPPRPNV